MEVRLPRLGEGADTGVVATIFVKEGDQVKKDQPVLELESEKAVATIPAPAAGTVSKVHVKEGDEIKVGTLIISLAENGSAAQAPAPAKPVIDARVGDETEEAAIDVRPEPLMIPVAPVSGAAVFAGFPVVHPPGIPPPASPTLRKIARELAIDLHRVPGSERGGRIVMSDLRAFVQRLQQAALTPATGKATGGDARATVVAPSIDFSKWGPVTKQRMSQLRKTIAAKMTESWTTVPHITQFDQVDVTDILALRKTYAGAYERKGGHLTLTCFALRAVVETLKKHPRFNSSLDEGAGEIVLKQYFHIGIAVDTEQGLIVPVLRDVDKKSILDLAIELNAIADRTRKRTIALEELHGGSFTISNQGGIGSGHFTPIVNMPEVAILGIGRGADQVVVRAGKTVTRSMLPIALSYDHRVNDGADAARFMVDLVRAFEAITEADVKI
jgi:pyruvate dehydrogenase E2 component (dihydrolipoamide acetyltransferase)